MGVLGDYAEMERNRERRTTIDRLRADGYLTIPVPRPAYADGPSDAEGIAQTLSDASARIADGTPLTPVQSDIVLSVLGDAMNALTPSTLFDRDRITGGSL